MADTAVKQRTADKRGQILAAAVDVFASRGFHRSRVADVARAADVADGTIYLYFKSKDDILISIFEEKMASMIEGAEQVLSGVADPLEKLRQFALFHMRNVEDHRNEAKVLQVELRLSNTFMKEYNPVRLRQYMDIIGQLIEEGREAGIIRSDVNPVIVRRAFFGALDEIAMQWILTPKARYGLKESAEQVADVFVRGLRAPATD
ncbi:MAG TPA: TetR family transcriptional regulator [Deltaproteobacteria bacterium]|nr:TetR family transcriptional regulator [Deltaproteobacteria bacterium]HCP46487.1 TetR family transcriptional regulator [Deltaproteobacteria bacterium]